MAYQMKNCPQCGAGLPVNSTQSIVKCRLCGAEYDVVQTTHRRIDGQVQIDWNSLAIGAFVGGVAGLVIGGLIFTPYGRSLGKATVTRVARAGGIYT